MQVNVKGGMWKGISRRREEFIKYTKLEVGDGHRINKWTDLWVREECLKAKFPI